MAEEIPAIATDVPPSGPGCAECTAVEGWWVHLRRCAACGHVGCCDSSPAQHASAHFEVRARARRLDVRVVHRHSVTIAGRVRKPAKAGRPDCVAVVGHGVADRTGGASDREVERREIGHRHA